MTPALLREAGEALYGPHWQSELARYLDVSDRTMRRWASARWPVPATIVPELRALLKARGSVLVSILRKMPR